MVLNKTALLAPRWGFPGLYWSSDISSTSLWIFNVDRSWFRFPSGVRLRLPTSSITFRTNPSWSQHHWIEGYSLVGSTSVWFVTKEETLSSTWNRICLLNVEPVPTIFLNTGKRKFIFPRFPLHLQLVRYCIIPTYTVCFPCIAAAIFSFLVAGMG